MYLQEEGRYVMLDPGLPKREQQQQQRSPGDGLGRNPEEAHGAEDLQVRRWGRGRSLPPHSPILPSIPSPCLAVDELRDRGVLVAAHSREHDGRRRVKGVRQRLATMGGEEGKSDPPPPPFLLPPPLRTLAGAYDVTAAVSMSVGTTDALPTGRPLHGEEKGGGGALLPVPPALLTPQPPLNPHRRQ